MSRGNQRVILPHITQKQNQDKGENYNFVTSKKKTVQFQPPSLDDSSFEDWEKKCKELQRDIDIRNQTIFSLQRNFESVSTLLRNEKQDNAHIKEEVVKLRESQKQFSDSEREYQRQIAEFQKNSRDHKAQMDLLFEERKSSAKLQLELSSAKNKNLDLEDMMQRKIDEIQLLISQNNCLKQDIAKYAQVEQNLYASNEQIAQQGEKIRTLEKTLVEKDLNLQISQQNSTQLTIVIEGLKKEIISLQAQVKALKSQENALSQDVNNLTEQLASAQQSLNHAQNQLNNQQTILQTRSQIEGQQNQQLKTLQNQVAELQEKNTEAAKKLRAQSEQMAQHATLIQQYNQVAKEIGEFELVQIFNQLKKTQNEYYIFKDKLDITQQELLCASEQSSRMTSELGTSLNKLSIAEKELKMKSKQILELEQELKVKSSLLSNNQSEQLVSQLQKQIRDFQEQQSASNQLCALLQKKVDDYEKYSQILQLYNSLKKPSVVESSEIEDLKLNIKQLTQSNKLILEEQEKKDQLIAQYQSYYAQLEEKRKECSSYQQELTQLKIKVEQLQGTNSGLTKQNDHLQKAVEQHQADLLNTNKENRNLAQQLQESQEQQYQAKQKLQASSKETKAAQDQAYQLNNEVRTLIAKCKRLEEEMENLNPEKLRNLQKQLETKEKEFQSQLMNIFHAQEAEVTSISCCGCLEVLKKAVTCYPCGHSYCEGCFKQTCTECKQFEGWFRNKCLDDLISKVNYSKQVLSTYKKS